MRQVTDDAPILLMAHEPDIFPKVPGRVALTVSGHTHGGQIMYDRKTGIGAIKFRYLSGQYQKQTEH